MKTSFLRFGALAVVSVGLALPLAKAQTSSPRLSQMPRRSNSSLRQVTGETFYLERIALPPGAKLHISLVGRVAGAEYLPLATAILPAKNGITPWQLQVPTFGTPVGPYRIQAWIVADNRLYMQGRDTQTTITNLDTPAKIRLKIVPAPQNIDGIGDGKPPSLTPKMSLKGSVSKLDRRALLPDSRIEINLSDVSLADVPSQLVVGQVIQLEGGQLPKSFELALEPNDLQPRRRYALSAKLFEAGKLTYISDTRNEVSPADLNKNFELKLVPAAP